MAGDRQHILPRFLLKGFASRIHGKEIYTWVYLRKGAIFEANINKIGIEKHFYGRKGEFRVDAEITDFEGEYAPLLDELRDSQGQVEIYNQRIANLITHFVTRTKHLRDSYIESVEYLSEKIEEYFSDPENTKAAIFSQPEIMRASIEKGFKDFPVLQPYKDFLYPLLPYLLNAFLETHKTEIQKIRQDFFKDIRNNILPKATVEGHIKGLSQGLIPEPRVQDYLLLRWFVINCRNPLILGDIGCLFETKGTRRFKPINSHDDEIINIFLPISDKQILIGTSLSNPPQINLNLINTAIAKCSREFFICSEQNKEIASLISLLGKEAEMMSKEEIENIVNKIIIKLRVK
ncbi:MAG: DUF4238 domain-containing protein [Desulfobaccales bacterium]|nr:DUF4238 domain-containing protein [Desulfobaccales bacterium]